MSDVTVAVVRPTPLSLRRWLLLLLLLHACQLMRHFERVDYSSSQHVIGGFTSSDVNLCEDSIVVRLLTYSVNAIV
jgi:hypothetical protein